MIKAVVFDMYETLITHYRSPLYFSENMAKDAGIEWKAFYRTWSETDSLRTLGKLTFQQVIRRILEENNCFSEEKYNLILKKRTETKRELFNHLHPQIIPMLKELKSKGLKIALISNCFNEEADVLENCILAPYFDVMCLSCRTGLKKPEPEIFKSCLNQLGLSADECIYCGDGGSNELEAAREEGMKPFQACWYFQQNNEGILFRNPDFIQLKEPLELVQKVNI